MTHAPLGSTRKHSEARPLPSHTAHSEGISLEGSSECVCVNAWVSGCRHPEDSSE